MNDLATSLKHEFVKAISGYESDADTLLKINNQIEYVRMCQKFGLVNKDVADCVLKVLISDLMEIKLAIKLKEWAERSNR
jgi:hypothetical protein